MLTNYITIRSVVCHKYLRKKLFGLENTTNKLIITMCMKTMTHIAYYLDVSKSMDATNMHTFICNQLIMLQLSM